MPSNNPVLDDYIRSEYIMVNKNAIKELGLINAVMLGELIDEYRYFAYKGRLCEDDMFYSTISNIEARTGLSRHIQAKSLKELSEMGLVSVFFKGMPRKRYVKLHWYEIDTKVVKKFNSKQLKNLTASSENISPKQLKNLTTSSQNFSPLVVKNFNHLQLKNLTQRRTNKRITNKRKTKRRMCEEELGGGQAPTHTTPFDVFWDNYPNRKYKAQCRKIWAEEACDFKLDQILDNIKALKERNREFSPSITYLENREYESPVEDKYEYF